MSRLATIGDGTNTVVVEDYAEPEVRLDYRGTSHAYSGFNRFGRVVDQLWRDYGNSQDADRFLYGPKKGTGTVGNANPHWNTCPRRSQSPFSGSRICSLSNK